MIEVHVFPMAIRHLTSSASCPSIRVAAPEASTWPCGRVGSHPPGPGCGTGLARQHRPGGSAGPLRPGTEGHHQGLEGERKGWSGDSPTTSPTQGEMWSVIFIYGLEGARNGWRLDNKNKPKGRGGLATEQSGTRAPSEHPREGNEPHRGILQLSGSPGRAVQHPCTSPPRCERTASPCPPRARRGRRRRRAS